MEPEIVNQNQRQYSLDNLLLGESPEAEHGDEPDCEGDFFRLSAQEWQNRTLMPLKEDLAMWISELLDVEITCQDFFEKLQDGIILCKLAKHITDQEIEWKGASSSTPFKAPINTRSGPFFSRENITHFLRWCKALKINDTCLFEPSDLLDRKNDQNVIICLYELAKTARAFNVKAPMLIEIERQLSETEHISELSNSGLLADFDFQEEPGSLESGQKNDDQKSEMSESGENVDKIEEAKTSEVGSEDLEKRDKKKKPVEFEGLPMRKEQDRMIRRIIKKCKCEDTVVVKKLSEGTYLINDKKVYIRILNRKHVMVRVGGGWQTFEEYLMRHDPTKVTAFARDGVGMLDSAARPTNDQGFLVANGAYRSIAV